MAHYLVTGGCGFIGSHLCDALVVRGDQVTVLDNLSTGRRENLPEGCRLLVGDATSPAAVAKAMEGGVEGAFHLAAVASVQRCNEDWRNSHLTNQTAAVTVFDTARRFGKMPVVYASSAAIYGDTGQGAIAETARPAPQTAYGVDKLGAELHGAVAQRVHGVRTVGLRPFNVYGPRQDPRSPYSGVISIFADRMARGTGIEIHGDGHQYRDFVHVSDVVRFFLAAMALRSDDPEVLNVASGTKTSLLELVAVMGDIMGRRPEVSFGPTRAGDIRYSLGDPSRSAQRLGVLARMSLQDGLGAMLGGTSKFEHLVTAR
ncbi:MAG: NAD-dependent epimerase/dehydratase family protein [Pseudorhodobacter sp.]|nr:NAD-dependent epimerase/dehydratase family protein [Pseudorhodobacter sp.]